MLGIVNINLCLDYDDVLQVIVDYVFIFEVINEEVWWIVCYCLMDILGCGLFVLWFLECIKYFGLLVEGIIVLYGFRVSGMFFCLDFVKVVWDIGCII